MKKRDDMKKCCKFLISIAITGLLFGNVFTGFAGNPDRSGQAGASELLINPWARSSGWGGANTSCIKGLESMQYNIAGLAFTQKTELIFVHTTWLKGSGCNLNSFGLSQKVGQTGVIGLGVTSMTFGDLLVTTEDKPEGDGSTFSPKLMNIGLSYAKTFSNSIYGGLCIRIINEAISDVNAQGVAIDAGIQYVTGETENIHFGISMKNVGPRMKFKGDGFSFKGTVPGASNTMTVEQRSAEFELPSLINIGAAYDIKVNESHKVTIAGNFTSNSFTKDQYILGGQYNFKNYVFLRAGYAYEKGITKKADRTTALTGLCAGFSVEVPMNKEKGSSFSLDYSYRSSDPFQGTHCIGARINL
jgi:hypothetical protein